MILLDTHSLIELFLAPEKLSARAQEAILQAHGAGEEIGFCSVSIYEIAIAVRRKRLHLNSTLEEFITAVRGRIKMVPLTTEIAVCAAGLPETFQGDPLDQIVAATAIATNCTLITQNDQIRVSHVCKVLW